MGSDRGVRAGDPRYKVLTVLGTRPEAIKTAPLIHALSAREDRVISRVCVTAQHRGMLDQVLHRFSIEPDHDLDLMTADQSASQVTARVLEKLTPVLDAERPDWVVVQGDTATTCASALAARLSGIQVAHVEAGLRSFDPDQPFPEELQRKVVTALAGLHFAPTPRARRNLLDEGIAPERIVVSGNTGIDALYRVVDELERKDDPCPWDDLPVATDVILATVHRRENLGAPLEQIGRALATIAGLYGDAVQLVCPVHPRPEVGAAVRRALGRLANVRLIEPLDYPNLVRLMLRCELVITDSGGLQEEAPPLGKPVLVLREVTERPEGVDAGSAVLVGASHDRIVQSARRLLEDPRAYARASRPAELYGDGRAAERIARTLLREHTDEWAPRPSASRSEDRPARALPAVASID